MTALVTSVGSRMSASSTSHAPPGNPRARSVAIRIARRVFPTPPGPTRLTRRTAPSFFLSSASSRCRPMKVVASAGRLPTWRVGLAMVNRKLLPESVIPRITPLRAVPRVTVMTDELAAQRVEVTFIGAPPARQIERASGVSDVEIDGSVLRCLVLGSFQPFLEALRGHEVMSLPSTPTHPPLYEGGQ